MALAAKDRIKSEEYKEFDRKEALKLLSKKEVEHAKKNKYKLMLLPNRVAKKGFLAYRTNVVWEKPSGKTERMRTIFIPRKGNKEDRRESYWHEAGHHQVEQKKILSAEDRKKILAKMKKRTPLKQLRKDSGSARPRKIPEEFLVELYAWKKTGKLKPSGLKKIKKNYPLLSKKLNQMNGSARSTPKKRRIIRKKPRPKNNNFMANIMRM